MTFLKYFIFLIIIPTIIILTVNPVMHKQFVLTDSDEIIIQSVQHVEEKILNNTQENIIHKKSNAAKNTIYPQKSAENISLKKNKEIRTDVFSNYPAASDSIHVKKQPNSNTQHNTQKKNPAAVTPKPQPSTKTDSSKNKIQSENNTAVKTTLIKKPVQATSKTQTITAQEEIIAWNQWNANIRNKLLSDLANLRNNHSIILKSGSNYAYTFRVSKTGIISNISVKSSDNSPEDQKVISAIESLVKSYSGSRLLDFPVGSQKTHYDVSSNIAISRNVQKDTSAKASDFSVYEKVKK